MEFITVDIFFILISLILSTTVFAIYAFSSALFCFNNHLAEATAVIDVIKILRKVCPVDFGNKWRLLPLNTGLSRCWTKKAQFPGFRNNIILYGTTCSVTCSSMYAFSLIADVSKWGEWEPLPSSQCLLLKPFCGSNLQKDSFMQADQVVGIQRGTDVQSYIAMYRFTSFNEKTVKWILFWNAKKLEFMFFLIHPAVSKTAGSQCVITHIFGTEQSSSHVASFVVQRSTNIKDFLLLSQLHIIASKYAPAIPAVSSPIDLDKLLSEADKEGQPSKVSEESNISNAQNVFMLVPIIYNFKYFYCRLQGFNLIIKETVLESKGKMPQTEFPPMKQVKESGKLRRSASDACIKSKLQVGFGSALELSTASRKENHCIIGRKSSDIKKRGSIIVEENLKLDLDCDKEKVNSKSNSNQKLHNQSDQSSSSVEKPKTSSQSDCSESHTDEDVYVNLHIIHEGGSTGESCNRSDIFCSSTSDFEAVESNQHFLDYKLADFLTQGNYGASELQAEMVLASMCDKFPSSEVPIIGEWQYNSTYKGISLLSKTTAGQFIKILSFLCQAELSVPPKDAWKCVKNPRFRFISDETVKTVKIVERISDSQKLIHVYHEAGGFLRKEGIDFCLLQTEREEANSYYSSFHSIEYEKCPLMTSVIRGSLRPSGWVVERLGSQRCKVTHLIQIIVSSPDNLYIQELNTLVPLAMHNLKNYIRSRPK